MRTKDFRSLPPSAQEHVRGKAVEAVLAGMTQGQAAQLFGVSRQAVCKWIKLYGSGGPGALRARPRGRPKGGSLLPWQCAQVARIVVDRHPDQMKLPFYLWTREAVGQLIERRFGIRLSVWTVGRYLKRWGFSPQKPLKVAFERDPGAVRRWLTDQYPAIRARAKRQKARIYWADEMGVRSDHVRGTSYGLRGRTPAVPGPGRRFGCQMISALTNRGHLLFSVFQGRFRGPVFVEFLRRLLRQVERRIFLIIDRHPVHRSAAVKKWAAAHAGQLEIFYLPGYSPELNPDEYLNQDVKSNAVGRRRASNEKELMANVRGYMRSTQKQPHIVRSYFQEEHVRYAAM